MRVRHLVLAVLFATLLLLFWLWLTMLSPWTYQQPAGLPPLPEGQQKVFVYGTLTYAPVRWLVYGRSGNPVPALLIGFERQGLNLHPDDDAQVKGLALEVTPSELMRLDRYERLGIRYERTRVCLADGQQAWVYQRMKEPPGLTESELTE